MKRRDLTQVLIGIGLSTPLVMRALPSLASADPGPTMFTRHFLLHLNGEAKEIDRVVSQNMEITGWTGLNRELEITESGRSFRKKAKEGSQVGPAGLVDSSIYFRNPYHITLPRRMRILVEGITYIVPRKSKSLSAEYRLSDSVLRRMPKVGMVSVDNKYTYLDLTPDF